MTNTAKWAAGIGGSAVAGAIIAYLGIGALLRSYPGDDPVEFDCGDDDCASLPAPVATSLVRPQVPRLEFRLPAAGAAPGVTFS